MLARRKVSTWKTICSTFLDKYYPPGTILKLKGEILQIMEGHDEPLYEALARFKGLLRRCPNHSFEKDQQIGILYNGFNEQLSSLLDSGANGGFLKKGANECMDVIEELAANSRGWSKERHSMKRVAAIESDDFVKKFEAIEERLRRRESPRDQDLEDVNYVQNGGSNRPYNNNYRPNQGGGGYNNYQGNRSHPNLSYANNNYVQPPTGFNVGKGGVILDPPKTTDQINEKLMARIDEFEAFKKSTEGRLEKLDGKLDSMEKATVSLTTTVAQLCTQVGQVHKQNKEEAKVATEKMAKKKWVVRYPPITAPPCGSFEKGSTSGTKVEEALDESSGPLEYVQRLLETTVESQRLVKELLEKPSGPLDYPQRSLGKKAEGQKPPAMVLDQPSSPLALAQRSLELAMQTLKENQKVIDRMAKKPSCLLTLVQRSLATDIDETKCLLPVPMTKKKFKLEG